MLTNAESFSGLAVRDLDAARRFYGETLGLEVSVLDEQYGLLDVKLGDGRSVLVYGKPDHEPANFTLLNFRVGDIDEAVDGLAARGVEFERYDGMPQDDNSNQQFNAQRRRTSGGSCARAARTSPGSATRAATSSRCSRSAEAGQPGLTLIRKMASTIRAIVTVVHSLTVRSAAP